LTLKIVIQGVEVVLAFCFHDDFFALVLSERGSDLPDLAVVILCHEVGLDLEPSIGVDDRATGSKGFVAILFGSCVSHLVLAHGASIAITVCTWVC